MKRTLRVAYRAVLVSLLASSFPMAHAELITTERALLEERRTASAASVNAFLTRDDVRAELVRMGVDPERAKERVQALTLEELTQLESRIDEAPAGAAGIVEVVGVVAIVLIVLELVGVTDVFTNF